MNDAATAWGPGIGTMRRNPGFTTIAILSLAPGIGANTAIFQPLERRAIANPSRRRAAAPGNGPVRRHRGQRGRHATAYPALTNPQWERLRDSQEALSGVLAWWPNNFGMGSPSNLRQVRGLFVSGDFFRVFDVPAIRGRPRPTGLHAGCSHQRGAGADLLRA
jgi:hypothetical protein